MRTLLAKEFINGIYQIVEYVTYSNGKTVKRYGFDKNNIPQNIEEVVKEKS
tara:strand:- start:1664 stop:1816 length:153 start_codon:yes stop_codon:yes gene_type:complete